MCRACRRRPTPLVMSASSDGYASRSAGWCSDPRQWLGARQGVSGIVRVARRARMSKPRVTIERVASRRLLQVR